MSRTWRFVVLLVPVLAACNGEDAASDPRELRALVDSLLPTLAELSGLEVRGAVQVASRSPDSVRAFVERKIDEDLPPERLEGMRDAYALLGLIPDTVDLRTLLLQLYTEQIVGYYDPDTRTLYVVEGANRSDLQAVIAHELVHALQDQHVDLDSLIAPARGNDRQLAAQAAIEGHATLVMFALLSGQEAGRTIHARELPDPAEPLRALETANLQYPVFRQAPRAVREMLLFPYVEGTSFVWNLWDRAVADRPLPPLGPDLPQSTEQVLHPAERFIGGRDEPTELRFDAPPSDWTLVYENVLGEMEATLFLEEQLGVDAADVVGWDGDRYRLLRDDDGTRLLDWVVVFDDNATARRFATFAENALGALGRPANSRLTTVQRMAAVRVRIADTENVLTAIPDPEISRR